MTNVISKITLSITFCIYFSNIYTQQNLNTNMDASRSIITTIDVSPSIKALGSPYIDENFSPLRMAKFNDKIYSGRFNAFNGEMEVTIETNKIIALDNRIDYEVIFTSKNKTYRSIDYITEDGNSKRGFLVVLFKNEDYALFKEESVKYREEIKAKTSYERDKPAEYTRNGDNYYTKLGDAITYLPTKKKNFLKLFPKEASKLNSYMKNNKLNPRNEADLILLIKYLTTISK